MRFIDPTIYLSRRSPAELDLMATAGIVGALEPITWLGTGRRYAETYIDDYERLTGPEARRANQHGIGYGVAVGVTPQEANNFAVAQTVIEAMPRFIKNQDNVVAIGEVGLERGTGAEEEIFRRQVRLAKEAGLPLVVQLPTHDRREIAYRTLTLLSEESMPSHAVVVNGVTDETLPFIREYGSWYGLTIDRHTHVSPERAVHLLQNHGLEGAMIHSAAGRVLGDPLAVPRTAKLMYEAGFSNDEISKLAFHNPKWFFSQGRPFQLFVPGKQVARRQEASYYEPQRQNQAAFAQTR